MVVAGVLFQHLWASPVQVHIYIQPDMRRSASLRGNSSNYAAVVGRTPFISWSRILSYRAYAVKILVYIFMHVLPSSGSSLVTEN